MKSKLVYWLTYAGMWLLALLPFRALYILSDGVCFLMRHVVHYRRKVVRKNLKNSFPEKSEAELREIEREFYRYICRLYAGRNKDDAYVVRRPFPSYGVW